MIKLNKVLSPDELEQTLQGIGAERYHNLHPFHKLLHGGKLSLGQVQAWALNRYVYQQGIPIKDYAILSNCKDKELRNIWRQRIFDHDGINQDEGGIERWLKLCEALGLNVLMFNQWKGSCQPPGMRLTPISIFAAMPRC